MGVTKHVTSGAVDYVTIKWSNYSVMASGTTYTIDYIIMGKGYGSVGP